MTQPIAIKCTQCKWFEDAALISPELIEGVDNGEDVFIYHCPAFPMPDGIPLEIRLWEKPHLKIRSDQIGTFVFTPKRTR